jgi:translation initiation factor 3 subunit G
MDWGNPEVDGPTTPPAMNAEDEKLPPDSDTIDPSTGIRTIVKHFRNEEGKLTRVTRRLLQKKKQIKVHRAVHERRQMPKFGDLVGVPPGLEAGVSYSDQGMTLRLTGEKEEEKSDVENLLEQIKGKKGFVFAQSQRVRNQAMESKSEEGGDLPVVPDSDGKFVPKVLLDKMKGGRGGSRFDDDLPTVRVGNLAEEATQDDLRALFRNFGMVHRVHIALDKETGRSRGYAFVTFQRKEDAERAIAKLNGHGYSNLILQVEWAKSMSEWKNQRGPRQA